MKKTVVITGSSRGIGKSITEHFIKKGGAKVICVVRNSAAVEILKREWHEINPSCLIDIKIADFCDANAVDDLCLELNSESQIDVLINNAGVFFEGALNATESQLHQMMNVNFFSALKILKAVASVMDKSNNGGHIFNIVSNAARRAIPGIGAYSASKHALLGFSDSLMFDLLSKKIKLSNINPAFVNTDMTSTFQGVRDDEKIQTSDIVKCIDFLLSLSPGAVLPNVDIECASFI